jgi:hypothetical protein
MQSNWTSATLLLNHGRNMSPKWYLAYAHVKLRERVIVLHVWVDEIGYYHTLVRG